MILSSSIRNREVLKEHRGGTRTVKAVSLSIVHEKKLRSDTVRGRTRL